MPSIASWNDESRVLYCLLHFSFLTKQKSVIEFICIIRHLSVIKTTNFPSSKSIESFLDRMLHFRIIYLILPIFDNLRDLEWNAFIYIISCFLFYSKTLSDSIAVLPNGTLARRSTSFSFHFFQHTAIYCSSAPSFTKCV